MTKQKIENILEQQLALAVYELYRDGAETRPLSWNHIVSSSGRYNKIIKFTVMNDVPSMTLREMIRSNMTPTKLSVTDLAKILEIGRPALSNFLNGKARLSFGLAKKLEEWTMVDAIFLLQKDLEEAFQIHNSVKSL